MDRLTQTPSGGDAHAPQLPQAGSGRDDVASGGVLLLVALAYGAGATRIPAQVGEPGPGFIPLTLAGLLAALAIAIIVGGVKNGAGRGAKGNGSSGGAGGVFAAAGRPWFAAPATIVFAALFEPLGFVVSTLGYSGYLTSLFTEDRKHRVAVPVFVVTVLFVFFRLALGVRLPTGLLG